MDKAKVVAAGVAIVAGATAFCGVQTVSEPPKVDGILDDACWGAAAWGAFTNRVHSKRDQPLKDRTEYALLCDDRNLYFAAKVHCSDFARVKARPKQGMWTSDTVEFFVAPTGQPDEFYQFAADFQGRRTFCQFWGEGGNITPDPYAPDWKMSVGELPDGEGWCVEAIVPFSGLYMTRNRDWSTTWLFNAGLSSHSMQEWSMAAEGDRLRDSKRFLRIQGLPKRLSKDDFAITDVRGVFDAQKGEKVCGTLKMSVFAGEPGEYVCTSAFVDGAVPVMLKAGDNTVNVPCSFPNLPRQATEIKFTRKSDGCAYCRTYPVVVEFEPVVIRLAKPGYRNNFYPGQDTSVVSGTVWVANGLRAKLTLEGPGFGRKMCETAEDGSFCFDTTGFAIGEAWLTAVAGNEEKKMRIRNLPPTGRTMAWVEDGCLVVNGRRRFKRGLAAPGYMGGEQLKERFDAEEFFAPIELRRFVGIEARRLVKGSEQREGVKDVRPCDEVFRKIDEAMAKREGTDFLGYYICDEPECRGVSPIYLRHIYEHVAEKDPYHIVRIASRESETYYRCCDLVDAHFYLNPHLLENGERIHRRPLANTATAMARFEAARPADKVLGTYSTCFAYRNVTLTSDYVTFDEYIASGWVGILNGAKSLEAYAYHDIGDRPALWHGFKYVNQGIDALEGVLVGGVRKVLARTDDYQVVEFSDGKDRLVVAMNFTFKPQIAAFEGGAGSWVEFRGARRFEFGGSGAVELRPLETLMLTSRKMDDGIPTYAETKALIDRLEAARKSRDNQLRGRYKDVVFSLPNVKRFVTSDYKLIDGTLDVFGAGFEWQTNVICEMSFTNGLRPVFDRVRLFGSNVGNFVVEVKRGGEWVEVNAVDRKTEKYSCEVKLSEAQSVLKMRLRIPFAKRGKNRVELYEIELLRTSRRPVQSTSPAAAAAPETARVASPLWSVRDFAPSTNRCSLRVPINGDCRWLVMDAKFRRRNPNGYAAWVMGLDKYGLARSVTRFKDGLYTLRLPEELVPGRSTLRFWLYNAELKARTIEIVREPPNRLTAEVLGGATDVVSGTRIRLLLDLAEPCEDVTVKFSRCGGKTAFTPYKVNGSDALELKATDVTRRHWSAEVVVQTVEEAAKREVYAVADVLGGGINRPIITNFTVPFKK